MIREIMANDSGLTIKIVVDCNNWRKMHGFKPYRKRTNAIRKRNVEFLHTMRLLMGDFA